MAEIIDGEIAALMPEWKIGPGIEESPHCTNISFCQNCASYSSILDYASPNSPSVEFFNVLNMDPLLAMAGLKRSHIKLKDQNNVLHKVHPEHQAILMVCIMPIYGLNEMFPDQVHRAQERFLAMKTMNRWM